MLAEPLLTCPVYASAAEALAAPAMCSWSTPSRTSPKQNILTALRRGAHVVVGTSGLTDQDYAEIDKVAREQKRGVLACGNFALTVVLLQKFAEAAAKLIPQWEIFDYAHDDKIDAPSGTARELAHRLSAVASPQPTIPLERTVGPKEARGATVSGSQVHSVRLPGYVISAEIIFGMPDQRLTIRHNSGSSARPYVDGAQLAIRMVSASSVSIGVSTPCSIFRGTSQGGRQRCYRSRARCRLASATIPVCIFSRLWAYRYVAGTQRRPPDASRGRAIRAFNSTPPGPSSTTRRVPAPQ